MQEFAGKVAVVTGAASGIGRALAMRFARAGMKVVLADVEAGALSEAARAVGAGGAETLAVRTDVSKAADVEALAERAFAAFGAVHVVCNNAGVGGSIDSFSPEVWRWVLELVRSGIYPSQVAAGVLAAIREDQFYVFTHAGGDIRAKAEERFAAILAAMDKATSSSV